MEGIPGDPLAASKTRVDWSLLLLRLAVGGLAMLHGLALLRHAHGTLSAGHALGWGLALLESLGGALVIIGLWTGLLAGLLAVLMGWPMVLAWTHGAGMLQDPAALFRLLATLACAVGGAGKWALDK